MLYEHKAKSAQQYYGEDDANQSSNGNGLYNFLPLKVQLNCAFFPLKLFYPTA